MLHRRPLPFVLMLLGTVVTRAGKASTDDPAERRARAGRRRLPEAQLSSSTLGARSCSASPMRRCHSVCVRMRRLPANAATAQTTACLSVQGHGQLQRNPDGVSTALWPHRGARARGRLAGLRGGALAAPGGIGGGGLFVPVLNLMLLRSTPVQRSRSRSSAARRCAPPACLATRTPPPRALPPCA